MIPAGNYLLFGRTGVGKSSLINTIAQAPLAPIDSANVCTQDITAYSFETPTGGYVLYDSPGLCEDDDPKTDCAYLSKIKSFLNHEIIKACDISLLFVIRLGSKRVRSEDHEVVKYLVELIMRFKLPVVLVATWADFTRGGESVRSQLDLARIQYISMIDKTLLCLSGKSLSATGFDGAYAVDNVSAAWLLSWKPVRLKRKYLPSLESYEAEVGHPVTYILDWISSAHCDPRALVAAKKLDLLAARIENLTKFPFQQDLLLLDFVSVSLPRPSPKTNFIEVTHADFVPYIYLDDANLLSGIESSRGSINKMFRVRSLDAGSVILRNLCESHAQCCTLLRPIASSRGLSGQMCSHLVSIYAAKTILEGLYICLNRADVVLFRDRTRSGDFLLEERMATFGSLLCSLFSFVDQAYLLGEVKAFIGASFFSPRLYQFGQVKKHFLNCMEILYLSVIFAEWALVPRPIKDFKDEYWSIDSEDAAEWIETSFPLYGYSELVLRVFKTGDWRKIVDLAMDCPNSMPIFLEDITRALSLKPLLVSERVIQSLGDARVMVDDSTEAPF